MPRLPRSDAPGNLHHVFGRGLSHRAVFDRTEDTRYFLSLIAREVRRGRLTVQAYCLMTNHYHLLVGSPEGGLSDAMQHVLNVYVRRFNRTRGRDGPLFRSRFGSRPVRSTTYRQAVIRYIDANPVAAAIVRQPWLFESGSARHYVARRRPPWLDADPLDELLGRPLPEERRIRYAEWSGQRVSPWVRDLVVDRMRRGAPIDDDLDALTLGTPEHVRTWLCRNAELADGAGGNPSYVPASVVERAVAQAGVDDGDRCAMRVGLLRQLSGISLREISVRTGLSIGRVCRDVGLHTMRLREDSGYGGSVAAVVCGGLQVLRVAMPGSGSRSGAAQNR